MTAVTGSRALSRETPKPVRKPVSLLLSFAARCTKRVTRRKSAGKLLAATFSVATVSIDRADRRPQYRTLQVGAGERGHRSENHVDDDVGKENTHRTHISEGVKQSYHGNKLQTNKHGFVV